MSELTGSGLVLQNNGGDDLSISTSGRLHLYHRSCQRRCLCRHGQDAAQCPGADLLRSAAERARSALRMSINIRIACGLHFAYAANAGDNTLSEYAIDSFTGTLTAVGTPVATGTSPYAITGSPDRQHVYVVNQVSNDISAYAVNATSGALTPIAGSPFAAGTDPSGSGVRSIRCLSLRCKQWLEQHIGIRGQCPALER